MTELTLTREQLRALMMHLHDVSPDRRIAMLGRLQHLQRLGWPPNSNPGKGKRVRYGAGQIFLVAFALELFQLGLTPEIAVAQIRHNASRIWMATRSIVGARNSEPDAKLIMFDPAAMSAALNLKVFGGRTMIGKEHSRNITDHAQTVRRAALVNVGRLIADIDDAMAKMGLAPMGAFRSATDLETYMNPNFSNSLLK